MTEYVLGFMFDDKNRVALIKKNRPDYQKDLINGIGGKVEPGESPVAAMKREFLEETGAKVNNWEFFAALSFNEGEMQRDSIVYCYATESNSPIKSVTDEIVGMYAVNVVQDLKIMPNLGWLVPLAKYSLTTPVLVAVGSPNEKVTYG